MKKYNCKNCGAELYWDSNANCLKCEYCDHEFQITDFETGESEKEQEDKKHSNEPEVADEHSKATDDSDSVELVVYKCNHCGAEIVTAKSTVATTCAYCGRAITMTNKMVDEFKPDLIIPFCIDEKQAKEIYKKYVHSSFLTPKEFKSENTIKKIKGIYVPFWLHTFVNNTNAVVYGENITSMRRGDDKIVEHHMYNIMIDAEGKFTNIPTDALKNLDNKLMDAIEPFDYQKLVEFKAAYMAGFYAEEYNEGADETIARATERAKQTMLSKVEYEAGVYGIKRIQSSNEQIQDRQSKYAMLPVWLLNVEHKGKEYLFAINGETGKIVGKLPMSIPKLLAVAGLSFIGSFIFLLITLLIGGIL